MCLDIIYLFAVMAHKLITYIWRWCILIMDKLASHTWLFICFRVLVLAGIISFKQLRMICVPFISSVICLDVIYLKSEQENQWIVLDARAFSENIEFYQIIFTSFQLSLIHHNYWCSCSFDGNLVYFNFSEVKLM